jgi:hypothetical protein
VSLRRTVVNICGKDVRVRGRAIRIAGIAADTYEFFEEPQAAVEAAKTCGSRIDLFTFMQRLPETTPKFSYPMEWDNLAVLPLTTFEDWWTDQIGFKARNKAKQAEKKGVTLREVSFDPDLVRGIWEVYNECPIRQGKPFAHFGKDIGTVGREAGTFLERSFFIGAFLDERLIGFAKLICDETRTQAGLVHLVSMVTHRDKAPTNALVAAAVRSCSKRGIPYLVYSRFNDGTKRRDSLIDFKERNGFQRVDLPRYYVPLTRTGRAALSLGLHKRFADRVPEPILEKLRRMRNAWYNRKFQSVTEAP